jgi:hypothetical protein
MVSDDELLVEWRVRYIETCNKSNTFFSGNYSDVHHNKTYLHIIATCFNTELCTVPHQSGHKFNTELCIPPQKSGKILNTELCIVPHQSVQNT